MFNCMYSTQGDFICNKNTIENFNVSSTTSSTPNMNCIFCCIFNQEKYVDMFFLLLESIFIYGDLNNNTNILVYITLFGFTSFFSLSFL